jgi:adenylate cyclase
MRTETGYFRVPLFSFSTAVSSMRSCNFAAEPSTTSARMASVKDSLSSRLRRHRRALDAIVALFWVLLFLTPYALNHYRMARPLALASIRPLRTLDDYFSDELARHGRLTPANPDIVFLGIDDSSVRLDLLDADLVHRDPVLSQMLNWPWPRQVYAPIYDRLADAGAKVVIFDILFQAPKEGDADLNAALNRHPNQFVIGCNFVSAPPSPDKLASPADTILPQTAPPDPRIAFVNFWPDEDGFIRQARFHRLYEGAAVGQANSDWIIHSMAARAMHVLGRENLVPDDSAQHRIRFTGRSRCFATYSLYQLFDAHAWKDNFHDGAFFKDKIVMVGPKDDFMQDQHQTPLGPMDGAEIHLQALNAALHGEFFWVTSDHFGWMILLAGGAGVLAWMIVLTVKGVAYQSGLALGAGVVYLAVSAVLFSHDIVPAVAAPMGVLVVTMVTALIVQFLLEQVERTRTRQLFERYVSAKVVTEIVDNPASYVDSLVGRRREVTVLFSDLRGFTSMTEQADSEQLVRDLNEYLQEMTSVLFEHEGILDKFIGDAVMAVWGSFTPRPEHDARSAVSTALGMHRALVVLNERRRERGAPNFAMGVGINHGEAIVGDIGSSQQTNFTVIGDSVNLASRLESATKEYGVATLISESMATLVRPHFHLQTVDLVVVKGRKKPVEVFTVYGSSDETMAPDRLDYLVQFELAMKQYRAQQFGEARDGFGACLQLFPDDRLAQIYRERCEEFLITPPPQPWDGVYVMMYK